METEGAVYARVPGGDVAALEAAIQQARSHASSGPIGVIAFDPAKHAFALVDRWGKSDDMAHWAEGPDLETANELAKLSQLVGEVVAFYTVEEGMSLGVYGAWKDGVLVRGLEYAEGEWYRASGEPQPWEAPLFAPAEKAKALASARDDGRDPATVEAAFAKGRIEQGAAYPLPPLIPVHVRDVLRAPSYGVQPWPRRRDALARPAR